MYGTWTRQPASTPHLVLETIWLDVDGQAILLNATGLWSPQALLWPYLSCHKALLTLVSTGSTAL